MSYLLAVGLTVALGFAANASAHFTGSAVPVDPAFFSYASTSAAMETAQIRFGERRAVPQLPCQPGDRPETGLQGRVPPTDILSGRALSGYSCNLEAVGRFPLSGAGTLESFGDCAYYGNGTGAFGTQVLDVSDGALPLSTARLRTPAMQDPWESMRVNGKRELLVADSNQNSYLDVYDVSGNCAQPELISSTNLAPARGHEGWFSPDGMTYYMSRVGVDGTPTVFPVDISDPAKPNVLAEWAFQAQTHGGSTTEDGSRSYICQQQAPPKDKLLIVDTSEVAAREPDPQPRLLAEIPLDDNQWCQAAYRVTYDGHPFLIQYGERSGAADCSRSPDNWANFGYPRIFDLADERHPKLVSAAMLEVALPEHCDLVNGEGAVNGLGYSVHHCSPDRLYDPTILACGYFGAGLRVLDIRNPHRPVEIAYFNPGLSLIVGTGARPVVRAERGEIWFVNDVGGFYVVRFADGVWPFEGSSRCPEFNDYYYAQYNPGSTCPTANFRGVGRPAPGGVPPENALKPKPSLSFRVSPVGAPGRPYSFRAAGRLLPPDFITLGRACGGAAKLTVSRGGRTLRTRNLQVSPSCRVAATVTLRRPKRLEFRLRFLGNAALGTRARPGASRRGLRPAG